MGCDRPILYVFSACTEVVPGMVLKISVMICILRVRRGSPHGGEEEFAQ